MKELRGGVRGRELLGTLYASTYQAEAESGEAEREIAGRQICRIRLTERTDRFTQTALRNSNVIFTRHIEEWLHVGHLGLHDRIVSECISTGLIWLWIGSEWRTSMSKLSNSQIP
jgi:hypothetical protein